MGSRLSQAGERGYLRDGRTPHWDDVARHLVQIPADELQWLGANNAVDHVNAVQQGWHGRSECAKVVRQSLQTKSCNTLDLVTAKHNM